MALGAANRTEQIRRAVKEVEDNEEGGVDVVAIEEVGEKVESGHEQAPLAFSEAQSTTLAEA